MPSSETMHATVVAAPRVLKGVVVPAPTPEALRPGEVLLRVVAGGICGSDVPVFAGTQPPRVTNGVGCPMHEVVGEVVASRRADLSEGAIVVGWADKANALADYVVTAADGLLEFSGDLDPLRAVAIQPMACVLSAADRLRSVEGARVAVLGLGSTGLLFSHVLRSLGADHVIGVDPADRAEAAKTFGVDEFVRATSMEWASALDSEDGRPSIVVEAVGHQADTLLDAISVAADGGQIFYFGIPDEASEYRFPMVQFLRRNLSLAAGITVYRRKYLKAAEEYLRRHPRLYDDYITHEFSAADAQSAFDLVTDPKADRIKVVLDFGRDVSS